MGMLFKNIPAGAIFRTNNKLYQKFDFGEPTSIYNSFRMDNIAQVVIPHDAECELLYNNVVEYIRSK